MNHIVIIGFMGSGKTRVGKRLAKDMNLPFVDLDKKISDVVKLSTSEFFRKFDEPFYRAEETFMMKELLSDTERKVISVGAAFPLQEQNEEILHNMGVIIYLKASAPTIIERLHTGQDNILTRGEVTEEKLVNMLESRDPIYQQYADIQVMTGVKSFEDLVKDIETKLLKFDEKKHKSSKVDFGSVKGEESLPVKDAQKSVPSESFDMEEKDAPEVFEIKETREGKAKKETAAKKTSVEEEVPAPEAPKKAAATKKKTTSKKAEAEVAAEEKPAAKEETPVKEEAAEKAEKPAKEEAAEKAEKPAKEEATEKAEKPAKEEAAEKAEKPAKEEAAEKAEKPAKEEAAEKAEKPVPEKIEKPEKKAEKVASKKAEKQEEKEEPVPAAEELILASQEDKPAKEPAEKGKKTRRATKKLTKAEEEKVSAAEEEEKPAKPVEEEKRAKPLEEEKTAVEPDQEKAAVPAEEKPAPKKAGKKTAEEGEAPKPRTRKTSKTAVTSQEEGETQKVVIQEGNKVILMNKQVAKEATPAPELSSELVSEPASGNQESAPAGEEAEAAEPVKKPRGRRKKTVDAEGTTKKAVKKDTAASKAKTVTTQDGKSLIVVRNHPSSRSKAPAEGEDHPEA